MKKTFLIGSLVGLFFMLFLATVVSANTAPTITAPTTSPATVYTNTNFNFNMTITDNESATFTGYVQFYVDGAVLDSVQSQIMSNNTNMLIGTLANTNFNKDAILIAEYWAGDGTDNTSKTNTTPVTVTNRDPTINAGSITIESHEDDKSTTVLASDLDDDTLTYDVTEVNPLLARCSISTSGTLTATRFNDTATGTAKCTVTVNDGYGGTASEDFTITVNRKSMLEIYDLDVYVDNEKDSNLDDGETIGDEAKPGSTVKFDFVIKSLFDDNDEDEEDIEIEDIFITVTIKNIDDDGDDDLEEETNEFDLDADERSSTKSVEFDIPMDVDEGDYEIEIVVEGEDSEYSQDHRVEWTLTLDVEKENHDMDLNRAEFDQTALSCNRETTFSVKLVNFGSSDEDELILTIQNSALGINIKEEDIEIDEGDDWSKSYTITVGDDVAPGTYKVETKMYYDSSDYYDKEFELNAYGSTNLIISKCVVTPPAEEEEEEEGEIIIVEPTEDEEGEVGEAPTGGEVTREISFMDTSLYLVLLVATVVILAGIFLAMIFRLFPRR